MKEYLLSTDNFTNPKVVKDTDAAGILLIRILIMVPGTNPLHPAMGVGLGTIYRYIMEDDLPSLETRISDQITTYLPPEFASVKVKLSISNDKCLKVSMAVDNTEFIFNTATMETPVQVSESL